MNDIAIINVCVRESERKKVGALLVFFLLGGISWHGIIACMDVVCTPACIFH